MQDHNVSVNLALHIHHEPEPPGTNVIKLFTSVSYDFS
jgi:hypothetical protein